MICLCWTVICHAWNRECSLFVFVGSVSAVGELSVLEQRLLDVGAVGCLGVGAEVLEQSVGF